MGEDQRNEHIGKADDAAKKENERRREGAAVCYGKGTLEEGKSSGKEGAVNPDG